MKRADKILDWLFVALISLSCSCVEEREYIRPENGEDDAEVTFSITLPSAGNSTRTLTDTDEDKVHIIHVLYFTQGTSGNSKLKGIATGTLADGINTYTVKLPKGTYDLMVLANSSDYLDEVSTGDTQDEVASKLTVQQEDEWNVKPGSSGYIDIPMWGLKKDVAVDKNTTLTGEESIKLIRMLARVNITIKDDAKEVFDFRSVRIYNRRNEGQIIPNLANWDGSDNKVTDASPTGNVIIGTSGNGKALVYRTENQTMQNEIYLFEAPAGDRNDFPDYPCLVIGGFYDDSDQMTYYRIDYITTNGTQTNYLPLKRNHTYEVVIDNVYGEGRPNPNEAYEVVPVNIQAGVKVWDNGGMEHFIIGSDCLLSLNPAEFILNGEARDAGSTDNDLTIYTDADGGWEITGIKNENEQNVSWLSVRTQDKKGDKDEKKTIKILLDSNLNNTQSRTAYIHIKAGRLTYKLPVTQNTDADLWITIVDNNDEEISELIFFGYPGEPNKVTNKTFTVRWGPTSQPIQATELIVGDELFKMSGFTPAVTNGSTYNNPNGTITFTVNPGAFTTDEVDPTSGNPFLEKGVRLEFSVNYSGQTARKSIYVRQLNLAILFDGVSQLSYLGKEYEFSVKSNSTWRIKKISDPAGVLEKIDLSENETGGNNTTLGQIFEYKMATATNTGIMQGMGKAGRWFEVIFADQNGVFPDATLRVIAITPDPNTIQVPYVDGGGISFPIRKMFWMWESDWLNDPDLTFDYSNITADDLEVQILWQAEQGLLKTTQQNINNIAFYNQITGNKNDGDPRDWYLQMYMKNDTPMNNNNALVAIKYKGKILWSWQIWISDFNENINTFQYNGRTYMDRNLGGGTYYEGSKPVFHLTWSGMYYQWGRKDPFMCSNGTNGDWQTHTYTLYPHAYNGQADQSLIKYVEVTAENNLVNSVRNPDTFYTRGTGTVTKDWYTAREDRRYMNDYLWSDEKNYKGMFDPCPYGWRVPAYPHGTVTNPFYGASGSYNQGWIFNEVFYLPNIGSKAMSTGNFTNYGGNSHYWLGNAIQYNVGAAAWTGGTGSTYPFDTFSATRATGAPIRCMKDNGEPVQ